MSIYVRWVQRSLNRVAKTVLKEDGNLGPLTRNAIKGFQRDKGLTPADEVVRPPTVRALVAAGADPPPVWVIGGLSTKYETGGRGPTAISTGQGDKGGVSYGSYQMTSAKGGTVARFVLQPDFPWRGDFTNLTPGSDEFTAKWKEIATAKEFADAEHKFIKHTHFDLLCRKIKKDHDIDITKCSPAMQDVIWSTAVHHGANAEIVRLAQKHSGTFDIAGPAFERKAIEAIYKERGRTENGVLVHFRSSPQLWNGLAKRFQEEKEDALFMLDFGVSAGRQH